MIDDVVIGTAKSRIEIKISPIATDTFIPISALVLPKLSSYVPPKNVDLSDWKHLQNITLADSDPFNRKEIHILIGADYYGSLLSSGLRKGPTGSPTAQNTIFGWILSGLLETHNREKIAISKLQQISVRDLNEELKKFWEQEELPQQTFLTKEELHCEELFKTTHQRNEKGNYIVRLPFRENELSSLGRSLSKAVNMLHKTDRRLHKHADLKHHYYSFLREYRDLNHMVEIPSVTEVESSIENPIYLPHFPIIRPNSTTTPLRVVFNASSKTSSGIALNDILLPGPKLQNDIITIILRWRTYRYVMTMDLCKMFRQILVDPRDYCYQRIVCKLGPSEDVKHFQLLTVTYGMTSSPFLANRVLQQLAEDEGGNYPKAKQAILRDFYVDDGLIGDNDEKSLLQLKEDLTYVLQKGGFTPRKWSTNIPSLLRSESENCDEINISQSTVINREVLGLQWSSISDEFHLSFVSENYTKITKRVVLSLIARLFDPLGWVAPVVITAKMLMQEIWIRKIDWDEDLPVDLLKRWDSYYKQLSCIKDVRISRWTGQNKGCSFEIHGFSDASKNAYGGCVYIKVKNAEKSQITLLIAKSRVSPIKPMSIPRLELCAIGLLAKLIKRIVEDLNFNNIPIYGWSDSMVALAWLSKPPSTWTTFVCNRVSEVQTIVPYVRWRHIPGNSNPADCITRGISAKELIQHPLWWHGPEWLYQEPINWPCPSILSSSDSELEKSKRIQTSRLEIEELPLDRAIKFSSTWPKLLRITAYCFRFIDCCKRKSENKEYIKVSELEKAKTFWLSTIQKQYYSKEIKQLRNKLSIQNSSSIKSLVPFLDKNGILRVTGRLNNASIPWNTKHPIILPKHPISKLIIEQTHQRALHGGLQLTLFLLRQNFWIVGAKSTIRKIIHCCITCVKQSAKASSQLMSDLPKSRITPSRSFLHTGLDYAGPISIKQGKTRGHRTQKGYICLFVCMVTKAIHLEAVSDCTTLGFLATLTRFTSRRGLPTDLYSDNGTNFQGAEKELKRIHQVLKKDQSVQSHMANNGITWHFNPPSAPHFGGLWEAGVKSVKQHFRRIVGTQNLTFEELTTLLCRIEACLNSRPIAALSDDSDDFTYLTPGHFLGGVPPLTLPEKSVLDMTQNRLTRWEMVQKMSESFWKRWSIEYPLGLQQRYKWSNVRNNFEKGDLVLLRDPKNFRTKWTLGRIINCHPGKDGLVRVVTVTTSTGECVRPITQLCQLPVKKQEEIFVQNNNDNVENQVTAGG